MSRPHMGDLPYGKAIFSCVNPGQVALTFDDGPWYWTSQIVEYLEPLHIKATFFVTGNNPWLNRRIDTDPTYRELLQHMHIKGHQIASHTWSHKHLKDIGREGRFKEMVYNEMAITDVIGVPPAYMRPPYGEWRDTQEMEDLDALGYHVIMYNVDTKDYKHDTEEDIDASIKLFKESIREDGQGSYIILAHDTHQWTAEKLVPAMVHVLKDRGYELVTVGECLNDSDWNWYRDPYKFEH
ncbi:carbohydrate esterase family 4 protein [Daldinia sp. FL1419]|nr:carbohydrate esterase family 4 protein [Daldinia sp. FL1419]